MAGLLIAAGSPAEPPATRVPPAALQAARQMAPAASSYPPLRDELVLERGPTLRGGAPSWTLYDPVINRFYRIGWLEFEILCRWHLRAPAEIAGRIARETTLPATEADVEQFARFLMGANLLRAVGAEGTSRLMARKAAAKLGWFTWLLHHYLFIRIPLVRPDRALTAVLPWLGWVYSKTFLAVTVLAGVLGLYLALRQWDVFSSSLPWFFSLEGAALAGAALLASKLLHELGHGLTAKKFGCRVPSMGVALLVMAPVLYTDTSAAWRLRERGKRLAIGSAGVAAECALAAYALLMWSFLPEGLLRSVVFVWATTTWVLTLLINMSPFMRFDGYYLFSDLIDVPNLQDRSFALTRHRIREILFGLGEPPPEAWSWPMQRLLVAYAIATWVYRFVLFLGIAVLVYHMFFKVLGILLFAVEMWWFIARPIVRELMEWAKRRRGKPLNARTLVTFTVAGVIVAALLFPWRTAIHAPAIIAAETRVQMFAQVPGRVVEVRVKPGDRVTAGQVLMSFASPDIAYKRTQAQRKVESLTAQIAAAAQDAELRAKAQLLARDLQGAQAELAAAQVEQDRLVIRAPIAGTVVELAEPLGRGEWVKAGELVGVVADLSHTRIDAYVTEADLDRVTLNADAVFVPNDLTTARVAARVKVIDTTAVRTLSDPELASSNGGAIATRPGPNETQIPELPVYRVTLTPTDAIAPRRIESGTAILEGRSASIAVQAWRRVVSVLVRESGF